MKCVELKRYYESIKMERASQEEDWDDAAKFVMPGAGRQFNKDASENSIDRSNWQRYDDTAVNSASMLASNIQSKLISPATRWFALGFEDDEINKDDDAREWMDDCESRVFNALQESNFNLEMSESLYSLAALSQGVMTHTWDAEKQVPAFKGVALKESFAAYDYAGLPTVHFRLMEWPISRIADKWEELPESIRDTASNPDRQTERLTILYAVYKRKDKQDADTTKELAPKEMPWGEKYFLYDTAERLGDEGGFYECPVYVVRWATRTGSDYGFGPTQLIMETIKMLNKVCQLNSVALEKVIDPCTAGTQRGVIGDKDLTPGGHTVVRSKDDLWIMESGSNFSVTFEQIDRWKQEIRDAYKIDLLMLQEGREMTAYEVSVRYQMLLELYSTMLTRIKAHLLNPLVESVFKQMMRNGRLLSMPDPAAKANLKVNYIGAMAKAQRSDEITATERWMQGVVSMAEVFPDMLDIVDVDDATREMADLLGVPAKMIRGEDEVNAVRKKRRKVQEAMQEAEAAQAEGDAMQSQAAGLQAINGGMQ